MREMKRIVGLLVLVCAACRGTTPPVDAPADGAEAAADRAQAAPPGTAPVEVPLVSPRGVAGSGGPTAGAAGLVWTSPPGWIAEPPANPMRVAQYRVPGSAGDAEMVVHYFGAGQGGDAAANAERWARQFQPPGGGDPVEAMSTEDLVVAGMRVLVVETAGAYSPMSMTAEETAPRPDQRLCGAIVEGPDANWFFKLTGPSATVLAQREAFKEMLRSLRRS